VIKSVLQGRPFHHPLHPALVHFPIGLWLLSLLLDLITRWVAPSNPLVQGAFYTIGAGLVVALVAAMAGFADWLEIRADHPAKRYANFHMALNLLVIALYTGNLYLRSQALDAPITPTVPLVLSIVAVAILSVSGYLGGAMIFDDGVGVGRHRRRTDLPRETVRISSGNGAREFLEVAPAAHLAEGETLRAEVGSTVITIVRLDGKLYAFQEFCTHRFGPLSEGSFHDGQVQCPWHRSCFDVRTGAVTRGPAKVDLRVYDVIEQEGQIAIRIPAMAPDAQPSQG
jgi:nitrite reductase/ring-hydroxylating ferredoxin subunit/uncharacterized membrane protein